jgi:glycosyltransferase involved in cell wall biosynthesis
MRILNLVHQYLPDKIGGTERYTQSIAHALVQRGHQLSIFYRRSAAGDGVERRDDAGAMVWAAWSGVASPTRRFLATFGDTPIERTFGRVLDESRPDLVHVQHMMGLPAALLDTLHRRRIPTVITLHDYWWVCANAQLVTNYDQSICAGPRRDWFNCSRCALARGGKDMLRLAAPGLSPLLAVREHLIQRGLQNAARIIAPTEFVKTWYAAHGLRDAPIDVLPHGIEPPAATGAPEARDPSGLTHARFAYIGGLTWQKGVHALIEAFNRLPTGSELWIAGDESADPVYAASLRASAGPGVRFFGALTHAQVWDMLGQVDVVAVPSLWYETFSLIAHEAFAAGRPVIASELGALAEVVRDGVDGLSAPPGDVDAWEDALRRMSDSPDLRDRLRAGIRPPLTLDEHVTKLEVIYADALS